MLVHRSAALLQISFYVVDHLVDPGCVVAEYGSPVALEHDVDQAPEGVLLVRYQLQQHARDEVLPLDVPRLGVVGAKRLQHVVESVLARVGLYPELFDLGEGAC